MFLLMLNSCCMQRHEFESVSGSVESNTSDMCIKACLTTIFSKKLHYLVYLLVHCARSVYGVSGKYAFLAKIGQRGAFVIEHYFDSDTYVAYSLPSIA